MSHAPIAIFVYKRPEHIRRTLAALRECPEFDCSPIYIFCDGPRTAEEESAVLQARTAARKALGGQGQMIESSKNKGLAASVIEGVTHLCKEYGHVIVVEDDLVVAPHFLEFMNTALNRFENDERVMQISGHMFPVAAFADRTQSLFLPFTTSWGWATWARAWQNFDPNVTGWEQLKSDLRVRRRFNMGDTYDCYSMLQQQLAGKTDSWAIRWYWSVFKANGLVLYPPRSLIENVGFDGSGTHGWRRAKKLNDNLRLQSISPDMPRLANVDPRDLNEVQKALRKSKPSVPANVLRFLVYRVKALLKKTKTCEKSV
jgi:GNT-I family